MQISSPYKIIEKDYQSKSCLLTLWKLEKIKKNNWNNVKIT